jgi:acyl carrier protein
VADATIQAKILPVLCSISLYGIRTTITEISGGLMDTRDSIRTYITTTLMRNPKYKLGDNDKLISGGLIDSFSLVELSLFLEEKFGVRPDDTELNAENMDTVQMIANYVETHSA